MQVPLIPRYAYVRTHFAHRVGLSHYEHDAALKTPITPKHCSQRRQIHEVVRYNSLPAG